MKLIDDIRTRDILVGLARLHSFIIVSDLEGEILWMSDELDAACGGAKRHIGHHLRQVSASLPGARAQEKLAEQISQIQSHIRSHETLHDVRLELGGRDGTTCSIDLSAFRTETEDGDPLVVSIIHPGLQGASNPSQSDQHGSLDSILDSSPDAVLVIDRFGFVAYTNEAVSRTLGVDAKKLVGQPIALLQPRSAEFMSLMSGLRSRGDVDDVELEMLRPDGSRVWVSVCTRDRTGADGRASGHAIYLRNISAAVTKRAELEKKNAELDNYVHTVSHDLRSPLVSLLGFTRLLRQDYDHVFDDSARHFADRIEEAGRTMSSLIEDLLELSQIGVKSEQRCLVDPRSVLVQLQAELKLRLEDAGVRLQIPASPPLVLCDRTRLYQLFSNLIGNAIQHMGSCDDPSIRVEVTTDSDQHVITVADAGRGIPSDDLEKIFEVFHSQPRHPKSPDARGSTGMGLAIVRKIAELHGGRAWAESTPGQGARFHVSLPRH